MVVNTWMKMDLWMANIHPHMVVKPFMVVNPGVMNMHLRTEMKPVDTDVVNPFVVYHWVMVDPWEVNVHPRMEINTMDMDVWAPHLVVNPRMKTKLWMVNMHPHVVMNSWVINMHLCMEMKSVGTDVVNPVVVYSWVIVDSREMGVHPRMEINTMNMDVWDSFMVVNLWMQMVNMHPHTVVDPFMAVNPWVKNMYLGTGRKPTEIEPVQRET